MLLESYEIALKKIENMLIKDYQLKIILSDCNPSSQKVNALVDLSVDISEMLPYFNTALKGLEYFEEERILTLKRGGRLITLRPRQIALTKLEDENEAREVMEELKQTLNEIYANRDRIQPTYTTRSVLRPLEVFKLLPGGNCRECGETTCMAFALKLVNNEIELQKCPLLFTKELETNRLKIAKGVGVNE